MKITHNTSGKHKCLICDEIFPSPAVLAEHKLTHCKVGPSGRCSHCSTALKDVTFFKSHLAEHNGHDIPIQCICCRQTLNSEYEISLHAKFHTKSTDVNENSCAMCLEAISPSAETRICSNCYKKHNFNLKTQKSLLSNISTEIQCNLCKKVSPSSLKLQEHLIEHTFAGCEDRGYVCYICLSVFTVPSGLQSHIIEHGLNARPYDCSNCTAKFFFRSELDHHAIEHEYLNSSFSKSNPTTDTESNSKIFTDSNDGNHLQQKNELKVENVDESEENFSNKSEKPEYAHEEEEEEEFIEVDNLEGNEKPTSKVIDNINPDK